MPGNKYNGDSNHIPGRVERLLRERELRKSGNRGIVQSNNEQLLGDEYLEQEDHQKDNVEKVSLSSSSTSSSIIERKEDHHHDHDHGKYRQRLLVVANRLPVSAIRKGEDSWSLEISAGGLVSALLGMYLFSCFFF
jgi:trehalose 6-phosphate synthase/phosphatase